MPDIFILILKWLVFITGILDSYKYKFLTLKVARLKSSKEISRKFINIGIFNRVILLIYVCFILHDLPLTAVSIIALFTMTEAFYTVYLHYPYRQRGLKNFVRPSIWKYTWNSLLPNNYRRKL